jgi:uncharacterized Zn finger protein
MNNFNLTPQFITENTTNSNRVYGQAIFDRGAVEITSSEESRIEAWVGGSDGKMIKGGGGRRKVYFVFEDSSPKWNCTCNPKNHQIFCKHCVALALYINQEN